ncbi:MAG: hypothetical protein K1X92_02960 [Bacteroidia bacterium]|nr:hypothetical protein [Bacteroidia bacterium]
MKKIAAPLILVFFLLGCSGNEKQTGESTQPNTPPVEKTQDVSAGLKVLPFDKSRIPSGISVKGKITDGACWIDKNGENVLVVSIVEPFPTGKTNKDEPQDMEAELYASCFIKKENSWTELWKIQDYVRECPLDIQCDFVPGALTVTDLDGNNTGESMLIYRLACRSDVSPSTQKLIMHEGPVKLALRGTTTIDIEGAKEQGSYKKDDAWKQVAPQLLTYAETQWKKFEKEF